MVHKLKSFGQKTRKRNVTLRISDQFNRKDDTIAVTCSRCGKLFNYTDELDITDEEPPMSNPDIFLCPHCEMELRD